MTPQVSVILPDGSSRHLDEGATGADLAAAIGPRLAKAAVVVRIDGTLADLNLPLPDGAEVAVVTGAEAEGREVLRHSTAHVLAQAVLQLWPGARFAIGPPIDDGFYYDFELPGGAHFSDEDLERIEERMRRIVSEDQPFQREEMSREEGITLFSDQPYKVEIIEGTDGSEGADAAAISAYRNSAEFIDLCRGPHVPSTRRLGSFKLMRVAGAYWRGDERKPQLQRIYGTAWESNQALADHLHRLEEAERRDHRKVGLELDLFHFPPEIGGGLPVFHPKGGMIRKLMEDYS
nr:TGS domain-containing protein [Actinomycetota bacterium]